MATLTLQVATKVAKQSTFGFLWVSDLAVECEVLIML